MWEKWNDGWRVWKEDNAFRLIFSVPKDALKVDLPYDAAFHQPQNRDSLNAGRTGFLDGGVFNYYKEYYAEPGDRDQTIRLRFEGVMGRASVYVNGSLAGENNYASEDWQRVLETMVKVDYSHPSVILYSTGNEITEVGTEVGYALSRAMTEHLHALDPSRFVTNGVNGIFAAGNRLVKAFTEITCEDAPEAIRGDINECMSVLGPRMGEMVRHGEISDILDHLDGTMDVLGYNYMTGRYETDCENHPNRVIIGTETYPKQIAENWAIIERIPAILGDFTWTGWDYLGETGGRENFPWLQNHSGDIDCTGERKSASYYREIVFGLRERPWIAVRSPEQSAQPRPMNPWQLTDAEPTWRFDGVEGRTVTVEIYSAGDEIELFLNGQSLGRKSADGLYAHFNTYDIPWQPGMLRAVSWKNGVQLGTCELTTAGDAIRWETSVEAHDDIALVTLEGRDGNSLRTRETISGVSLALEGPAELLAFGGCESQYDAGYTAATIDVTNGRAMAILRRTGAGEISVCVRAKDMKEAAITIGE